MITLKLTRYYLLVCRVFLFCGLGLFSGGLSASSEINIAQSRLIQLAHQIEKADAARKYDFLNIALQQMYNVYAEETRKAATETPGSEKKRAKVFRWQYSSARYLESIEAAMVQLDIQASPDFFVSKQNKIVILLENQPPVIISGPNNGANSKMQQQIVEQFCLLYDCGEYFKTADPVTKVEYEEEFSGSWSIARDLKGTFVSDVGISFDFNSIKNRASKEQWMTALYQELSLVLASLKKASQQGYSINWSRLSLETLPVTDNAFKLIINSNQKYLKLDVPILAANPELLKQLIPWLKNRFIKYENLPTIIRHSDRFYKHNAHLQ